MSPLAAFLQLVSILSGETETGVKFGPAFVVFPHLMKTGFARQAAQRPPLVNVAFGVTVQFQQSRFLVAIPTIGKDDEYLPVFLFQNSNRILKRHCSVNNFVELIS